MICLNDVIHMETWNRVCGKCGYDTLYSQTGEVHTRTHIVSFEELIVFCSLHVIKHFLCD